MTGRAGAETGELLLTSSFDAALSDPPAPRPASSPRSHSFPAVPPAPEEPGHLEVRPCNFLEHGDEFCVPSRERDSREYGRVCFLVTFVGTREKWSHRRARELLLANPRHWCCGQEDHSLPGGMRAYKVTHSTMTYTQKQRGDFAVINAQR